MDIYEPVGDTMSKRPVVILAFGGSFITGDRLSDSTIVRLCRALALRGYVTASIDYRKADNPFMMFDSAYAINTVVKAVSDGKAAVRYFTKDAATANVYKIDVDNIFVGGNSAGAVLYMHVGFIDSLEECHPGIRHSIEMHGGFDGDSGHPGYPCPVKGVISLAGGLHGDYFVSPTETSVLHIHGSADNVVPYGCAPAMEGMFVSLCGLGALQPKYIDAGVDYQTYIFEGDGHCPWSSDLTKYNIVQNQVIDYLYNQICSSTTSVPYEDISSMVQLFPNPASEELTIQSMQMLTSIQVTNIVGQVIYSAQDINTMTYTLLLDNFSNGVIFIKLRSDKGHTVKKVIVQQ